MSASRNLFHGISLNYNMNENGEMMPASMQKFGSFSGLFLGGNLPKVTFERLGTFGEHSKSCHKVGLQGGPKFPKVKQVDHESLDSSPIVIVDNRGS